MKTKALKKSRNDLNACKIFQVSIKWKNGMLEKWNGSELVFHHSTIPVFQYSFVPLFPMRVALSVLLLVLLSVSAFAQHRIAGFVTDKLTGEKLIGANIVETGTANGTMANSNGYFSMVTKSGNIQVSFIGYKTTMLTITTDSLLTVSLEGDGLLDEIVVKGNQTKRFNVSTLSQHEMQSIPSLGGKPDVLKALQLLPGIQAQQEGSSLLNVRGGNPGENLYLIDNTPLIYVNHLGGFASVFNPDMINGIEVYKGGFPPKYGGKLSSVIAITQREGDKSKLKGSFSLGITDASFSVEGPLLNDKASFIVTGRKTLIDLFMLGTSGLIDGNEVFTMYGFHDINGKFSWHPDGKNSFYLNLYQGDDYLKFWNKDRIKTKEKFSMGNSWGNWMASARWNRAISSRLIVDNAVSLTHYRLKVATSYYSATIADTVDYKNLYYSSVQDMSLRSDWQLQVIKDWDLEFGGKATLFTHIPNKIEITGSEIAAYERVHTTEAALYLNNRFTLFDAVDGDVGARLVNYHSGSFSHWALEPRVMLNARLSPTQTLNLTWQQVNQYAHLAFTSGSIMNNEIWIPADENIAPSNSTQYSVGWKGQFFDNVIESELNLYYKELNNLATYKEGYNNLMGDGGWRSKIETGGIAKAKGVELLVRKVKGKWTGFLGYTYSNATRQFPGINKGKEYLFDYDRPHSFSININRKLNEKWSFNASWVYQTGLPYTPVLGRQLTPDVNKWAELGLLYSEALIYGERNSARMKDYHRLDLGATLTTKTKRGRKAQWNFSVYNVYNRHNPTSYYYATHKDGGINYDYNGKFEPLKQFQISIFPIIPSVSYKVFFGDVNNLRTPKSDTKKREMQKKKSEESYSIKKRWTVKLAYSQFPILFSHIPNVFKAEINYGLLNFLEMGAYLGYCKHPVMIKDSIGYGISSDHSVFYGVSTSLHFLPLILKKKDFWMDVYLTGKYGGYTVFTEDGNYPKRENLPDYGIYGGLAIYPFKHLGFFGEYGYGNRTNWRAGVSIKF